MSFRNLSPQHMFENLGRKHRPECSFAAAKNGGFQTWREQTLPRVLATLGTFPDRTPANPQLCAEWEHDGLLKQRWLIDVQEDLSAILLVNYPKNLAANEKRPALLCWHGHGPYGKEPVMGNDSSTEMRDQIACYNYNYGHVMARHGFITYAIDWIGAGERNDNARPNFHNQNVTRDWCNLYYLHATMLGMTSISINAAHGMAATDVMLTLAHVDADRLGAMGLSGGGSMTLWTALCDERFKAAEIICYSALWAYFGMRDINYCGMQVAPGLFKLVDLPDLQGLLAPRPLLVDIGVYDTCFSVDEALACHEQVKRIYTAAGHADRLELDLFPGQHAWSGRKSQSFFEKHL